MPPGCGPGRGGRTRPAQSARPRTKKTQGVREWRAAETALAKARTATGHWRTRLSPADTARPRQAQTLEAAALAWLRPAFWRLRRVLGEAYDFSATRSARPGRRCWRTRAGARRAAQETAARLALERCSPTCPSTRAWR